MLTDPEEIAIIQSAKQANVRDPNRSRAHFERIFADFLVDLDLTGSTILDLGPGQFDFGVLARERGAEVVAIDYDPAVVALGRHKGFEVVEGRIQGINELGWSSRFDGAFCKFSLNAFWFADALTSLDDFIDGMISTTATDAWGWIAPWNGIPKKRSWSDAEIDEVLRRQAARFVHHGWSAWDLTDTQAVHYGVNGRVANHALFTRAITVPAGVAPMTIVR